MQRWDLLPLYRFDEVGNQHASHLLISTYINDKLKEFWFNRDELPKIRSLRDSIFSNLVMSTKRYWKRKIVTEEMLEYIYGINKEPLKVNWLQFVNPSENMLRNSLTYIHPIKHLSYNFSTYNRFHEAWPLICNPQLAANQVHICVKSIADYIDDENFDEGWQLSSFLNQLNQGNRCSLIFYAKRLDSEMIFDDFIGGTIEVFKQAKNPGNLIEYLRIWSIKIVEEEIEDFKQVLLEKGISVKEKPRSSFDLLFYRNNDNEDRDKKYFGTLKMEDWNLDLELDVHKKKQDDYTYSDDLEDYDEDEDEYKGLVCDDIIKIMIRDDSKAL
uniref:Uncharacterized protein n=1 Tax=Acrobeloides nanus TaxID=290746 RepID=A0A914EPI3_9BILA